jgi:hypothetical protein
MGAAHCQVSSNNNKATLADNGLLSIFARKELNQKTLCSVHRRSTLILWFYEVLSTFMEQIKNI